MPGFPVPPEAATGSGLGYWVTEQGHAQPTQLRELSEYKALLKNRIWEPSLVAECLLSMCKEVLVQGPAVLNIFS